MRSIGRKTPQIHVTPCAQGLRDAAAAQPLGAALAAVHSTGIAKGVYRFKTHEAADAQRMDGLVAVIAANAALRSASGG